NHEKLKKESESQIHQLSTKFENTNKALAEAKEEIEKLSQKAAELESENERNAKSLVFFEKVKEELADTQKLLEQTKKELQSTQKEFKHIESSFQKVDAERRKLKNQIEDMKGKVRVYARCRPMSNDEINAGYSNIVQFVNEATLKIIPKNKEYQFNRVFRPDSTQDEVFEDTKDLVGSSMDGY